MTVVTGTSIELQARLYLYEEGGDIDGYQPLDWYDVPLRYLDFNVYKTNADGTNGDLIWHDTAITNCFTYNANPNKFKLTEKGTYNLVVKYDGNLKHSNATAKIYMV